MKDGIRIRCLGMQRDMYIVHAEGYLKIWAEAWFEGLSIQKQIHCPLFPLYGNGLPFLCETTHYKCTTYSAEMQS